MRAAVEGSIAEDELTRIDIDEIVELEISGVDEKDLTYLSFVGSNSVLHVGQIVLCIRLSACVTFRFQSSYHSRLDSPGREIPGRESPRAADVARWSIEQSILWKRCRNLGENVGPYPSFPPPRVAGAWRFEELMV